MEMCVVSKTKWGGGGKWWGKGEGEGDMRGMSMRDGCETCGSNYDPSPISVWRWEWRECRQGGMMMGTWRSKRRSAGLRVQGEGRKYKSKGGEGDSRTEGSLRLQ